MAVSRVHSQEKVGAFGVAQSDWYNSAREAANGISRLRHHPVASLWRPPVPLGAAVLIFESTDGDLGRGGADVAERVHDQKFLAIASKP